jgi:hypothetical protein
MLLIGEKAFSLSNPTKDHICAWLYTPINQYFFSFPKIQHVWISFSLVCQLCDCYFYFAVGERLNWTLVSCLVSRLILGRWQVWVRTKSVSVLYLHGQVESITPWIVRVGTCMRLTTAFSRMIFNSLALICVKCIFTHWDLRRVFCFFLCLSCWIVYLYLAWEIPWI